MIAFVVAPLSAIVTNQIDVKHRHETTRSTAIVTPGSIACSSPKNVEAVANVDTKAGLFHINSSFLTERMRLRMSTNKPES